ncbi:hypothetical protein AC1031_005908 [Aphanomyces cochlioides]|nr:hypothetical protein AC1031_005908 [Aphanomyces cochlioides]
MNLPQDCLERFCSMSRSIPFAKFSRLSPVFQKVIMEELPSKSAVVAARLENFEALRQHPVASYTTDVAKQATLGSHLRLIKYLHEVEAPVIAKAIFFAALSDRVSVVKWVDDNWNFAMSYKSVNVDPLILHTAVVLYMINMKKIHAEILLSRAKFRIVSQSTS